MRTAANNCVKEDARNVVRPTGTSQRDCNCLSVCQAGAIKAVGDVIFHLRFIDASCCCGGEILYGDGQPFFSVLAISIVFTSSLTVWELSVALSAELLASRLDMQMRPTSRPLTLRCCWSFSLSLSVHLVVVFGFHDGWMRKQTAWALGSPAPADVIQQSGKEMCSSSLTCKGFLLVQAVSTDDVTPFFSFVFVVSPAG